MKLNISKDQQIFVKLISNDKPNDWRLATPQEKTFFESGGKNINDMPKKQKSDRLDEANERYPKGTKFIDLVNGIEFEVSLSNSAEYMNDCTIYVHVEPHKERSNKRARVYRSGQWAEIVTPKSQQFSEGDWVYIEEGGNGAYTADGAVACVCSREMALSFSSYGGESKYEQAKLYVFNQNKSYGLCKGYKVREATKREIIEQHEKGCSVTNKVHSYAPKFPSYVYSGSTDELPRREGKGYVVFDDPFSTPSMRDHQRDTMHYMWGSGVVAPTVSPGHFMCSCDMADPKVKSVTAISKVNLGTGIVEQISSKSNDQEFKHWQEYLSDVSAQLYGIPTNLLKSKGELIDFDEEDELLEKPNTVNVTNRELNIEL